MRLNLSKFRVLAQRLFTVRESAKKFAKLEKQYRDELLSFVEEHGEPNPSGGKTVEDNKWVAEVQIASTRNLDQDACEEFFEKYPELRAQAVTEVFDKSKISSLYALGKINDSEYRALFTNKIIPRLRVRKK